MIKLAHFSDIHLTAAPLGWRPRDLVGKRATGWVNVVVLGRRHRFRHANTVVEALLREFRTRGFDHLVFSGDATTLAFDTEMIEAARRLGVGDGSLPPAIAVPGNHDVYVARAEKKRAFEAAFGPWQHGRRVGDHTYPFAQKVGHVWLIALNSSVANVWPWDASGRVGTAQLERFKQLTAELDPGPRIVVSHYPILTRNAKPEPRWHRLRDWQRVRDVAAECGVSLWLHGHKHHWYYLPVNENQPFISIGVGSSAQTNLWGYHEYTIDGWTLRGTRRVYNPEMKTFRDSETFAFELPGRALA